MEGRVSLTELLQCRGEKAENFEGGKGTRYKWKAVGDMSTAIEAISI